ncbi:MAG TPA: DinB family protein [Gemmatimonadaceae bacterium]|nr:DinB family protein [Gemmatimonadaceae bacterium]
MRVNKLMVACACVVGLGNISATRVQSDPLTGAWTGDMVADDRSQAHAVTLELKLAGRDVTGVISGPTLSPGDITGTFDAATGVLKFAVAVRGATLKVNFDGKLSQGTIEGTISANTPDGPQSGKLKATKRAPGAGPDPTPSRITADAATEAVRRGFTEVSGWVTKAAELVPADKYSYRPVGTVRTFGEIVGHVVDAYQYYCERGAARNVQWSDAVEKGVKDKAALTARLKTTLAMCTSVYGGTAQMGPLIENIAHTNLHYGNMVTYMRMLGLTPPSS